jgi:sarcosine oxidase subunit beta
MRAEVVVVGGGITGVAVAYFLAERGFERVVVFERSYLGSGSTFKCAGGIRASFTSREHIVLMKRSIELWGELSRRLGIKYARSGYLWLASREEDLERLKRYSSIHNQFGVSTRFVEPGEVEEMAPALDTSRLVGALYDPLAGKASPFDAVHKLYLASREMGVEYRFEEVGKILVEGGAARGVASSGGITEAESVVVAAGVWSRQLLEPLGVSLPVEPEPHHAALTEEYGRLFDPLIIDLESGAYAVQTFHGHVLMGVEIPEQPSWEPGERLAFLSKVVRVWSRWLPWLPSANILRYWVGHYEVTPDHHPVLGPVGSIENLFVATGFSGHGFMMGPVVGEELASWVASGAPRTEEAAHLTLRRFEEGRLIKELAVIG